MMKKDFRKCYLAVDQYGVQHFHDNEIAFYHKGLEAPQVEFIDVKYANEIERERDTYKKCAFQAQEMAKEIAEKLTAAKQVLAECDVVLQFLALSWSNHEGLKQALTAIRRFKQGEG